MLQPPGRGLAESDPGPRRHRWRDPNPGTVPGRCTRGPPRPGGRHVTAEPPSTAPGRRRDSRAGFSLVEAIVALAVLAVILGALVPAFAQNLRTNTDSEKRTAAVAIAQQEVDNLRASSNWPSSGTTRQVQSGQGTYETVLNYQRYCDGGTCFDGARIVTVEVRFNDRTIYEVETVFTLLDEVGDQPD
ncbi:MAG: type II secretion system protein [Gemmatimonadales bacterium]|nr:MAG: type II secretion system protein [Gemmatimonadales bacterium]